MRDSFPRSKHFFRFFGRSGLEMFAGKSAVVAVGLLVTLLGATALLAQSGPAGPVSAAALEFPVLMRQKVEAGKTPAGTKIQARLTVATLVNGVVIPEGAWLSGEVIESAAKSATEPSRLAIRLNSADWKTGAAPVALAFTSKVFLTAWYYPLAPLTTRDFPHAVLDASHNGTQRPGGAARYPDPNTTDSPPYSRGNTDDAKNPAPTAPSASVSQHRVLMKNVESTGSSGGAVTLTSTRSNIKLDKSTTYVFAAGDLGAGAGLRVP